ERHRVRHALDGEGLRQTRNAFEEHVAAGEQPDQQAVHHLSLPNHRAADFDAHAVQDLRRALDAAGRLRGLDAHDAFLVLWKESLPSSQYTEALSAARVPRRRADTPT